MALINIWNQTGAPPPSLYRFLLRLVNRDEGKKFANNSLRERRILKENSPRRSPLTFEPGILCPPKKAVFATHLNKISFDENYSRWLVAGPALHILFRYHFYTQERRFISSRSQPIRSTANCHISATAPIVFRTVGVRMAPNCQILLPTSLPDALSRSPPAHALPCQFLVTRLTV